MRQGAALAPLVQGMAGQQAPTHSCQDGALPPWPASLLPTSPATLLTCCTSSGSIGITGLLHQSGSAARSASAAAAAAACWSAAAAAAAAPAAATSASAAWCSVGAGGAAATCCCAPAAASAWQSGVGACTEGGGAKPYVRGVCRAEGLHGGLSRIVFMAWAAPLPRRSPLCVASHLALAAAFRRAGHLSCLLLLQIQ